MSDSASCYTFTCSTVWWWILLFSRLATSTKTNLSILSICEFHPRCCIKIGLGYQPWPARQFDCTYDGSSFVDALRVCHGYPPLHCHPFYCHHDQFHLSVISSILPLRYFESITASLFSLILHHDDMMEKIFRNDSSVCFGGIPHPLTVK